ncbi:MAG: DUF4112 domain-containing protein [Gemmatimonadales bacterium]|nr:DUF4112 domain-containing protein [Gemmatimonadales bacterium]
MPTAVTVQDRQLDRLRSMAHWLDDGIRIPGTPIRFGADAILDIVPVLGDFAGVGLSGWILLQASRMGASKATLLRMVFNIAIDAIVGIIPGLGVLFDAAWKANLRNIALLERQTLHPAEIRRSSSRFAAVLVVALILLMIGTAVGAYYLLRGASALLSRTY